MPKKIENYLTEGLPSKIYYYAFPKPISRYAIANLLHGKPVTSHISTTSREMIKKGYLIETSEGILSNVEPLANEIENDLKNHDVTLTLSEKRELTDYLDKDLRKIQLSNYLKGDVKIKGDINAYDILTHILIMAVFLRDLFLTKGKFRTHDRIKAANKFYDSINSPISAIGKQMVNIPLSPELIQKLNTLTPKVFEIFQKDIWKK